MRRPGRCGSSGCEFSKPIRKERGSGERKRHRVSRLSPYRRSMEHCRSQTCPREFVLARHRRRGAEMRRALSAKKREEPSYFRGSIPTGPRLPSSSAQPTTQPGTGTMPDAGGVGGGGHAPRLPYRTHSANRYAPPPIPYAFRQQIRPASIPYAFRQQIRPASHTVTHSTWRIQQKPIEENQREEKRMAEREGFEPSERFPPRRFSKPVLSATQPSLR